MLCSNYIFMILAMLLLSDIQCFFHRNHRSLWVRYNLMYRPNVMMHVSNRAVGAANRKTLSIFCPEQVVGYLLGYYLMKPIPRYVYFLRAPDILICFTARLIYFTFSSCDLLIKNEIGRKGEIKELTEMPLETWIIQRTHLEPILGYWKVTVSIYHLWQFGESICLKILKCWSFSHTVL